jgi:hypothetical protein
MRKKKEKDGIRRSKLRYYAHSGDLEQMLFEYTGIRWEFVDGLPYEHISMVQIMPLDPADDLHPFWYWHLDNSRQWFLTRMEASVSLLISWLLFRHQSDRLESAPSPEGDTSNGN